MSKTKLALAFAMIFLVGAAAGGAGGTALAWRMLLHPPSPDEMSKHMGARLQSRLQLTEQQAARVRTITLRTFAEVDACHLETSRRLKEIFDEGDARIAAELTPEQQRKFAEMQKDRPRPP